MPRGGQADLGRDGQVDDAAPNTRTTLPDGPDDWRKVVVGYDGSEAAKRALAHAGRLVGERTRVVVVAVAEPYPRSGITVPANRDPAEIRAPAK